MFISNKSKLKLIAVALVGVLLLAACQSAAVSPTSTAASPTDAPMPPTATSIPPTPTPTEEMATPSVVVEDQDIMDDTVVVQQVVSDSQGWIVIHADQDGAPGPVIGYAQVTHGDKSDVVVEIDTSSATETMYAMLHVDAGNAGEYEFPGDDVPVSVEGQVVVKQFKVTGGMMVQPSIGVEDQDISAGSVIVPQVDSQGPGWVVIHNQVDGAPGPVIGHIAVEDGMNKNVEVPVDPATATETLYAMLHVDAGTVGEYEFPGDDAPAKVDDQVVVKPFKVTGLPPSVIVMDQEIEEDSVTIRQVVSEGAGWIVIHADQDGGPGVVIGYAAVEDGVNADVNVQIDESDSTETLYAMLHLDAGAIGTYEFPGDDGPVRVDDQVVVSPFKITGSMTNMASVSAVDNSFGPQELTVQVGTTVVWTNNGSRSHTVTADDGSFDSGTMRSGGSFEFTFTESGEYPYHCAFHGGAGGEGMAGTIIVTPGG